MQLHNDIIAWLKTGQEYKKGVELLKQFSTKKKLVKRLSKSVSDFNKGLLKFELENHARYLEASQKKNVRPSARGMKPKFNTVEFSTKPAELQELEVKKYNAYMKAHRIRFNELPKCFTDEERAPLVKEIVELMEENKRCWDLIDHFKKHKSLPAQEPKITKEQSSLTPLQMQKKLQYRRSNISTYRKFIKDNPEHATTEKKMKKIQEWEQEISYYENQLKTV